MSNHEVESQRTGLEIAVIGMAGRFPGADSVDELWENLKNGVESISFFSDEELVEKGIPLDLIRLPNYVRARGLVRNSEYFDAAFFGYTALEAELMDPQTRVFYECVWWALEHAGYDPINYSGAIGIYAGASNNWFWEGRVIASGRQEALGDFATNHLIDRDFIGTRMAYRLHLTGPAISLKTACSTSLITVDLACRALLTGQCDLALAGGVSVPSNMKAGYIFQEGMINSPDGHVRTFDAKAKGVVFCEGAGVVVLKRLEDALADGDRIMAMILGSAVNNDGSRKGAFSAPSVEGQADVIRSAYYVSGVNPETVTYIEAHGTGTELGDPIEVEALKQAFATDKKQYCAIGSVKTNIGHLDTAAGVAGLIKAVLCLYHRIIPPSLHFEKPNPKIDFANSPFFVNTQLREWKRNGGPLRAGVSSFGVGGTNVHAILQEAPERTPGSAGRSEQLIILSARNEAALQEMSQNLHAYLEKNPQVELADVAYTLQVGRSPFKHRQLVTGASLEEVAAALRPVDEETPFDIEKVFRSVARDECHPVFMFSGQGSQYVDMALGLYREEPDFTEEMDGCFDIFRSQAGYDLREILYPGLFPAPGGAVDAGRIDQTEITQPVTFILEYALSRLLMKWGVKPYAMIGHSIGEYVAACLADVFSLADAIRLVTLRGRLMQQMPAGSMLSVTLAETELIPLLPDNLEMAAVNAPNLCVVSGTHEAVAAFAPLLEKKGINCRILHTSHAFHSRMMEPMLADFSREVAKIKLQTPRIPYVSNLTGNWITVEEATDPQYWASHIRKPVLFAAGLAEILKDENAVLLELGPGRALATFARQNQAKKPNQVMINLVRHPTEEMSDTRYFLDKIGRLWLSGQVIDWPVFFGRQERLRLFLPLYPFQRQKFWIERGDLFNRGSARGEDYVSRDKEALDRWFYIPSWKRTPLPAVSDGGPQKPQTWLFFADGIGFYRELSDRVSAAGDQVVFVMPGQVFESLGDGHYRIDPRKADDYKALIDSLKKEGKFPTQVIHLWNITANDSRSWGADWDTRFLDLGFYSLLYLAAALGEQELTEDMAIKVLVNGLEQVNGEERLCPEKASLMGPVMVIPREFPRLQCSVIDVEVPQPGSPKEGWLIGRLLTEMRAKTPYPDNVIAYRLPYRLVQTFEAGTFPRPATATPRLRSGGVYLISGGLGGIGLVMAEHLARTGKPKLILTGRSPFPSREKWDQWLIQSNASDPVGRKILKLKELEELGASIQVFSVDVTDYAGMKEMLQKARAAFGPINGVIHAAGLPGGGMIQLKTREMADKVLLPKIRGTLVLDELLTGEPLDFILLCSSISSVVPAVGQVDYFSANAFLDAYAYYKTTQDGVFTLSINWDAWQEVGMAVEAAKDSQKTAPFLQYRPLPSPHPLFDRFAPMEGGGGKYIGKLTLEKDWPLNEHQTADGIGLLPGTTYLEMVRAAWERNGGQGHCEISEVNFLTPMMVAPGEEREVNILLEKIDGDGAFQFTVESSIVGRGEFRQQHALGRIRGIEPGEVPGHDLEVLKSRCNLREVVIDEKAAAETMGQKATGRALIIFGPRWKTHRWIRYGKNECLAMFELPAPLQGELEQYRMHPALLDSCTGILFNYVSGGKAYIPFSYKRLHLSRPLPARLITYCRLVEQDQGQEELLRFNVTIMDEWGQECAEIEEFTMREVTEDVKGRIKDKAAKSSPGTGMNDRQRQLLKFGILPEEGIDAFSRLLAADLPQVVASTSDLRGRIKSTLASGMGARAGEGLETARTGVRLARPELNSIYIAPKSELQKKIVDIWQDFLGIEKIGIHDDFFELGGDSLKIVQLNARLKKSLERDIPVAVMFRYLNVHALAQYLDQGEKEAEAAPAEKEAARTEDIEKGKSRMKARMSRR